MVIWAGPRIFDEHGNERPATQEDVDQLLSFVKTFGEYRQATREAIQELHGVKGSKKLQSTARVLDELWQRMKRGLKLPGEVALL